MPTLKDPDSGDFDKLMTAISSLTSLTSVDGLLDAFGLTNMPTAQRYGVMFGCLTFFLTVTAVVLLLVLGGTFKRIKEQSGTGEATVPDAVTARSGRPLLLERLLEARQRMLETNYPDEGKERSSEGFTNLTEMLLNVAPDMKKVKEIAELVDDEDADAAKGKSSVKKVDPKKEQKRQEIRKCIPEGYEANYVAAYRKCQDKPGGAILSGLPEARFEAYARAYAGCGVHTTSAYRRSYARMYESVACKTHGTEEKFSGLFLSRPFDLVGRTVRLEPLEVERHLQVVYDMTCGEANLDDKAYDPNEVWGFLDCGPFSHPNELRDSFVFQRRPDESAFAIVETVTDRVLGVIILTNDDPKNLTIQMELPIVKPTSDGTVEQIEACFLLLDRLFALGYRRIQISCDSQDPKGKKLPGRLGFTQEGMIPKHMVVKEANRDSNIYGMLNSDWDKGARSFLYKKLHGAKAQKNDDLNNAKEGELEEQQRVLKEKRAIEEAEKTKKTV